MKKNKMQFPANGLEFDGNNFLAVFSFVVDDFLRNGSQRTLITKELIFKKAYGDKSNDVAIVSELAQVGIICSQSHVQQTRDNQIENPILFLFKYKKFPIPFEDANLSKNAYRQVPKNPNCLISDELGEKFKRILELVNDNKIIQIEQLKSEIGYSDVDDAYFNFLLKILGCTNKDYDNQFIILESSKTDIKKTFSEGLSYLIEKNQPWSETKLVTEISRRTKVDTKLTQSCVKLFPFVERKGDKICVRFENLRNNMDRAYYILNENGNEPLHKDKITAEIRKKLAKASKKYDIGTINLGNDDRFQSQSSGLWKISDKTITMTLDKWIENVFYEEGWERATQEQIIGGIKKRISVLNEDSIQTRIRAICHETSNGDFVVNDFKKEHKEDIKKKKKGVSYTKENANDKEIRKLAIEILGKKQGNKAILTTLIKEINYPKKFHVEDNHIRRILNNFNYFEVTKEEGEKKQSVKLRTSQESNVAITEYYNPCPSKMIYVEGKTDKKILEKAIKIFSKKLDGIIIIDCGGDDLVRKEISKFAYDTNKNKGKALAIFDYDKAGSDAHIALTKNNSDFEKELKKGTVKSLLLGKDKKPPHILSFYQKGIFDKGSYGNGICLESFFSFQFWEIAKKQGYLNEIYSLSNIIKNPHNQLPKDFILEKGVSEENLIYIFYEFDKFKKDSFANYICSLEGEDVGKAFEHFRDVIIQIEKFFEDEIN